MSTFPDQHEQLLQKYLDGHCTAEEVAALYAWLQTSGTHRVLLATMQAEFDKAMHTPATIPAVISDRMENRLLQEISQAPVVKINTYNRLRWIAAAAVIAAFMAGAYFYYSNHSSKSAMVAANEDPHKDIGPGTNKALLTLANGNVITLDSAGNQVIRQSNATAHQHNGQLQYASAGDGDNIEYNVLTVPRGGQFNIVLPDGSKVWLNAASRLRYPTAFNGTTRAVELQGQGYFEVAANAKQPFTVKVNDAMDVQVLGTHFDIMAYADEKNISTTLITGAVKVTNGNIAKSLKPGEQALLDPATGALTVQQADVEQAIAWKTGFFEFDNANLSLIMRQLSRWYDVDIINKAPQSKRLFGGRISRNLPLSEILHMLEANGAAFTLTGRQLTVNDVK